MSATEKQPVEYANDGRRKFPALVAILAILLMLAGGAYMLWSAWNGGSVFGTGAVVGASDPPSNHPRWEVMQIQRQAEIRAAQMNQPDGFRRTPAGADPDLKAGTYHLTFRNNGNGGLRLILLPMQMEQFISAEQRQVLTMRGRILSDKAVEAFLKVTPEQMTKLRKVSGGNGGMLIEPADEQKVLALYKTYQSSQGATKTDAEKQIVALAKDIAVRSTGPTKKSVEDRVAGILDIMTKDQVEAFKKM